MDYEDVFNNSPKGDEVRKILEICDHTNYPPKTWSRPKADASRTKVTRFLSAWEKLTGKSQGPADEGLPFSWSPEELRSRSAEFLAIHKAVIFKKLSVSEGVPKKIDLFDWFWKEVIEEYIDSVADLKMPDELSVIDLSYGPTENYNLDKVTEEDWSGIIGNLGRKTFFDDMDRVSDRKLGFTTAFCIYDYPREERALLSEVAVEKIRGNKAVKVHLLLWWGWPGAPFLCMQDMFVKHIEHLAEEGYLRQTNPPPRPQRGVLRRQDFRDNEYKLTDAGKRRLEDLDPDRKAGLVDHFKEINLVDLGNLISSVCAQLFSR